MGNNLYQSMMVITSLQTGYYAATDHTHNYEANTKAKNMSIATLPPLIEVENSIKVLALGQVFASFFS